MCMGDSIDIQSFKVWNRWRIWPKSLRYCKRWFKHLCEEVIDEVDDSRKGKGNMIDAWMHG